MPLCVAHPTSVRALIDSLLVIVDAARFFLQAKASSGHEHKEESDDEGEEKKAEEAGAASGSSAEAPAPAPVDADAAGGDDAAGDEDLDAEMLEALGAKKSLPQGIMSEEDMDRMVCGCDTIQSPAA